MQNRTIRSLKKKLKVYRQIDLEREPENPLIHYKIGEVLEAIGEKAGDGVRLQEALNSYGVSIELSKYQEPLYLASRSHLQVRLGNEDSAIEDMIEAMRLPQAGGSIGRHIGYTFQAVSERVQEKVKTLRDTGKISPELAGSLIGLSEDSFNNSRTLAVDGENYPRHDIARIEVLISQVQKLEQNAKDTQENNNAMAKELESLKNKFGRLDIAFEKIEELREKAAKQSDESVIKQVSELQESVKHLLNIAGGNKKAIAGMTEEIKDLLTEDELNTDRLIEFNKKIKKLEKDLGSQQGILDNLDITGISVHIQQLDSKLAEAKSGQAIDAGTAERIKELEAGRQRLAQQVEFITRSLDITGITEQSDIGEEVLKLKMQDTKLYEYYRTLYFELEAYLEVYAELGTGLLEGKNLDDLKTSRYSNIKSFFGLMGNAGWEVVSQVLDEFGVLSALYGIVDSANQVKSKVKKENQITKIHRVLKSKLLNDAGDLNKNEIAKIALGLAQIRQEKISTGAGGDEQKEDDSMLGRIDGFLGKVSDKFAPVLDRYTEAESKLAAHDALMLIGCLCNRYKGIESMQHPLSEFFSASMVREIEVSARLGDVLDKVASRAKEGHWQEYRGKDLQKHKGISQLLDDGYIEKKLGSLSNSENIKMAKMLYFAIINVEAQNEGNSQKKKKNAMECLQRFKEYDTDQKSDLLNKIAKEQPQYFLNNSEVAKLIDDPALKLTLCKQIKDSTISTYMMNSAEYDHKLLHPALFDELRKFYSIDELVHLSDKVDNALVKQAANTGDYSMLMMGLSFASVIDAVETE